MAKITLGNRPDTVSLKVKFEHLDGTKDSIRIDYIYRTRREFAEFVDESIAQARALADQQPEPVLAEPVEHNQAQWFDRLDGGRADYIMQIAKGWDLPQPFDRDHVLRLVDEYPQAAEGIVQTYRQAIIEGRTGN